MIKVGGKHENSIPIYDAAVFKPYKEMTDREANQYFEYYVSQIPIRIEYLQNFLDNNVDKKSD